MAVDLVTNLAFLGSELRLHDNACPAGEAQAFSAGVASRLANYVEVKAGIEGSLNQTMWDDAAGLITALRGFAQGQALAVALESGSPQNVESLRAIMRPVVASLMQLPGEGVALARRLIALEAGFEAGIRDAVMAAALRDKPPAQAARNSLKVDGAVLARFLKNVYPEETRLTVCGMTTLSAGMSKCTVLVDLGGVAALPEQIVLRADAAATYGGASVVDEHALYRALHPQGIRVPRPIAADLSGDELGAPCMITERKFGISLGSNFQLPQPNAAAGLDLAREIAAIHQIALDTLPTEIDNRDGTNSAKALEWLALARREFDKLDINSAVFEAAFIWLEANASLTDAMPRCLVHGDLHLNNLLIEDDAVSAVFDWEFAHVGNPAYDLGYFHYQADALCGWDTFLDAYAEAGGPRPDDRQADYAILLGSARVAVMICQTLTEYRNSKVPGVGGAMVTADLFYEQVICRMHAILDRVMR